MQQRLVSVIVVNYNGKGIIWACLEAIIKQSYKKYELIIVENSSCDGSLDEIHSFINKYACMQEMKLISIKRNAGFTGGNIEGFKETRGEYIALLNNDTEPDEKWLEELVSAMDNDPKIGICASKMIVHGADILDSAGDGFSKALRGIKQGEGENHLLHTRREYVFGGCAGAALYRRKMIDEVGFFDEDFFLIHEDTDLNFRAQLSGWKVLYVPTAIVYHKVRSSIGHMSDMAVYFTLRNSEFVRIKNTPLGVFIRCFPEFLMGIVTEFIYFAIKHKHFRLYLKAKRDAIRMFLKMLKKREAILKNRKVSNRYLLNIMTPVWQRDFLKEKIKKFLFS